MTASVEYHGQPLLSSVTHTLEMTLTDAGAERLGAASQPERRLRIDLLPGQRWPSEIKRGTPITVNLNEHVIRGWVMWRRMHRLVLHGLLVEVVIPEAPMEVQPE